MNISQINIFLILTLILIDINRFVQHRTTYTYATVLFYNKLLTFIFVS